MRALAILSQRNEGAFLLEWLAHHKAVGFTDFLVFSNDCQDGSDRMLDHLATSGWLVHLPNLPPYDRAGIQFSALKQAATHPLLQQTDWILPLDIDEFVNIHVGDRSLPALLAALPDATAITLTWRLFGNAGIVAYDDQPITTQFTRAAPSVIHWPWRAAMFKTLYRNDGTYGKPGIHRPRAPDPAKLDTARWFDGHGRALPARYHRAGIFSAYGRPNHGMAQINHYPLGAMESYLLKADRGRAVHTDQRLGMDYWVERNFNTDEDRTIHALAPQMQREYAALTADPVLAGMHRDAVAWRHDRFAELMRDDEMRALMGRLMMTPPSHPLDAKQAAPLLAHAIAARHSKRADEGLPQS
ncbi:glycosyltransferase family 2 protein [Seohaeicola saemankumensis]|uniref:glycosyltransferase family 2 protein n=1 Tax=Seohaeicola saemankumensis TaxID=481181 RepID=UPI001E551D60|nr:glycosyltransferase family 2 protein [Seohaeicola saemankumensis]MCD1626349.1 glycosyltransferase family 2 protein [Seohaeicola saemankumensis]